MALDSLEIVLRAHFVDGGEVQSADFSGLLSKLDLALAVVADRGAWYSGKVLLASLQLADFKESTDPHDSLAGAIQASLVGVGDWLRQQSEAAFESMKRRGLTVVLLIDAEIDQDQLDLVLPSTLLS